MHSCIASLYGEAGRYQESEEMFKKAMKISPTYTEAYFNLGKLLTSCKIIILLLYLRSMQLTLSLMLLCVPGTLYVQMGRLDDGERYLNHALKLNPNHRGAMNNLRVVEHQRKKHQKQG